MVPTRRYDSAEQEAYLNLWRTYDRLRALEDEFFNRFGLTPQQYNVLRLLKSVHPERMASLAIADRLISRAPDITRMLDKLESLSLIRRSKSTTDRRTVLIEITPAGIEMLDAMAEPLRDCHQRQLGHLSSHELTAFVDLLKVVREPHEPAESIWR